MSEKRYNNEFAKEYVRDISSVEKQLFTLKMIRDTLFDKANDYRKNAQDLPYSEKYEIPLPEESEHKFKEIPKEPKFKMSSKAFRLRRRLFKMSLAFSVILLVSFIAVVIASGFFRKDVTDYSAVWVIFILMCAVTALSFLSVFVIIAYEYLKFKEKHLNWENEKARIEAYNEKLSEKVHTARREIILKYNNAVQDVEQLKRYDALVEKAKAEITDLQSGRISSAIVSLEGLLKQLYSVNILPVNCRRIDAVVCIDCLLEADSSLDVNEASQAYIDSVNSGECVRHLSDFYSEYSKYRQTMPAFVTVLDKIEKSTEYFVDLAAEQAEIIAKDAADEISNSVNGSIVSLEFQRIFERTELAIFAADANTEAIQYVSRYMSDGNAKPQESAEK